MTGPLFKFLRAGGVGAFSGRSWGLPQGDVPGSWQEARHPLEPCRHGVHVCRSVDLPYWMSDELYEVEVDGARLEHREKLVVERARLIRRVDSWPVIATELTDRSLRGIRQLAVRELELAHEPEARELAAYEDVAVAARFATETAARRGNDLPRVAWAFLGFLGDAVEYSTGALSPTRAATYSAYIAAYAADRATPEPDVRLPPDQSPFQLERRRQAAFLVERIGATPGS